MSDISRLFSGKSDCYMGTKRDTSSRKYRRWNKKVRENSITLLPGLKLIPSLREDRVRLTCGRLRHSPDAFSFSPNLATGKRGCVLYVFGYGTFLGTRRSWVALCVRSRRRFFSTKQVLLWQILNAMTHLAEVRVPEPHKIILRTIVPISTGVIWVKFQLFDVLSKIFTWMHW